MVKFGALLFVLKLPATYAIEMQLLGGIWMGQLFPSVVRGGVYAVVQSVGAVGGMGGGDGERDGDGGGAGVEEFGVSVASAWLLGGTYAMYAAVPALVLNLAVSVVLTVVFRVVKMGEGTDVTDASAYVG